jgi:hypothetical protein
MIRTLIAAALALLIPTTAAFARPTDDQAWKVCKAWALGQVKDLPVPALTPAFSSISMQNSTGNFTAVFFAVDGVDSTGAVTRHYGRCITDGTTIRDFSTVGGSTEPIVKAWVLDRSDPRRRAYTPPPE